MAAPFIPTFSLYNNSRSFDTYDPRTSFQYQNDSTRTTSPIVTGTSVIGIKYNGGVVIGSDTLASYGSLARFQNVKRIKAFGNYTVIGAGGELSDFQYITDLLNERLNKDKVAADGVVLSSEEIYHYLTRIMYARRSKMDPLWNQLVIGGRKDGKSFLGYVDLYGCSYADNHVATGYGAHLATPIIRREWREDLTEEEAVKLLETCLRVLFYRDCRASNRIQIARISDAGITISDPYELSTDWAVGNFVKTSLLDDTF